MLGSLGATWKGQSGQRQRRRCLDVAWSGSLGGAWSAPDRTGWIRKAGRGKAVEARIGSEWFGKVQPGTAAGAWMGTEWTARLAVQRWVALVGGWQGSQGGARTAWQNASWHGQARQPWNARKGEEGMDGLAATASVVPAALGSGSDRREKARQPRRGVGARGRRGLAGCREARPSPVRQRVEGQPRLGDSRSVQRWRGRSWAGQSWSGTSGADRGRARPAASRRGSHGVVWGLVMAGHSPAVLGASGPARRGSRG
jgi:hypothetical protein